MKIGAKDAMHLARLLRLDEVVPVAVPSADQEAAQGLVRAREDCRGDLMRARRRLSKLLLRQGIVYNGGNAWTGAAPARIRGDAVNRRLHERWVRFMAWSKRNTFTDVAVARELVGWCWSLAVMEE